MGRKAVGPVRCVMHVKEPSNTIRKEKGFAPVFLAAPRNRQLDRWRFTNALIIIIIIIMMYEEALKMLGSKLLFLFFFSL